MVLYARGDINVHAPGSTGHVHRRPQKESGQFVPIWGLNCPPCEAELHGHPAWSASRYKIPLTPDEEQEAKDAQAAAELAMQKQQMLLAQAAFTSQMAAKGAVPDDDPDDIAITSSDDGPAATPDPDIPSAPEGSDYAVLNKQELRDLAKDRGLPVGGTREELIARHVQHDREGTG